MLTTYFKDNATEKEQEIKLLILKKEKTAEQPEQQKKNWWQSFMQYAEGQDNNRMGWVAISLAAQGCVLAPLTILAIFYNGNPFILWIPCMLAFAIVEIANLAAMPTKITVPVFFAGIFIDIMVIAASFIFF